MKSRPPVGITIGLLPDLLLRAFASCISYIPQSIPEVSCPGESDLNLSPLVFRLFRFIPARLSIHKLSGSSCHPFSDNSPDNGFPSGHSSTQFLFSDLFNEFIFFHHMDGDFRLSKSMDVLTITGLSFRLVWQEIAPWPKLPSHDLHVQLVHQMRTSNAR
jgi:hypothetical protein